MEVRCDLGIIDIVDDVNEEIIEVKEQANWLAAVRQINAYHQSFPDYTKRIHLFSHKESNRQAQVLQQAREVCGSQDIKVTWELSPKEPVGEEADSRAGGADDESFASIEDLFLGKASRHGFDMRKVYNDFLGVEQLRESLQTQLAERIELEQARVVREQRELERARIAHEQARVAHEQTRMAHEQELERARAAREQASAELERVRMAHEMERACMAHEVRMRELELMRPPQPAPAQAPQPQPAPAQAQPAPAQAPQPHRPARAPPRPAPLDTAPGSMEAAYALWDGTWREMVQWYVKGIPWKDLYGEGPKYKLAYGRMKLFWNYVDLMVERGMEAADVIARLDRIRAAHPPVTPSVFIKQCFYGIVGINNTKPPAISRGDMRAWMEREGLPWVWD